MTKIPEDFQGSVHVYSEGFKVLVAGDEIPEGVEIDPAIFKRDEKGAAKAAQPDERPVEDVLAEVNEAPVDRTRGKRA